jgi:hypothetical protein
MVTEKDLYTGLQFKHIKDKNTIYSLDLTKQENIIWYNGDVRFSIQAICDNINSGVWKLVKPINKIYETW